LNGKVGKIVGLDPAGPLFDVNDPKNRLNSDSAKYTECIHTDFKLGIGNPICKVDFFVNRGSHQPGCVSANGNDNMVCSHLRAVLIFLEAVINPVAFYGKLCSPDYDAQIPGTLFQLGPCKSDSGAFINGENNAELVDEISRKVYNVRSTNAKSPYGKGKGQ
jgi:hypothetical protein